MKSNVRIQTSFSLWQVMFDRECVIAIDGILSSFDVFSVFRLCSVACGT